MPVELKVSVMTTQRPMSDTVAVVKSMVAGCEVVMVDPSPKVMVAVTVPAAGAAL
jgi:hypothetical protein